MTPDAIRAHSLGVALEAPVSQPVAKSAGSAAAGPGLGASRGEKTWGATVPFQASRDRQADLLDRMAAMERECWWMERACRDAEKRAVLWRLSCLACAAFASGFAWEALWQ